MKRVFFIVLMMALFVVKAPVMFADDNVEMNREDKSNPSITIELKNMDSVSSEIKEIKESWKDDKIEVSYEVSDVVGNIFVAGLWIMLFFLILFLGTFIFWVAMLVHAIKNPIESKAIWILIMLLFYFVGAIIYYFAVKKKDSQPISADIVK